MSSKRSSVASYSSISSYGSNFETAPAPVKTPWELERYKRHSIPRRTRPVGLLPPHVFRGLPREIYDCILQQLQFLHFDAASQVCPSCYLRDVRNLGLTSRAWGKAAREQLYRSIWIVTDDAHHELRKLKVKNTGRLKLLRRTLRERSVLARYVQELKLSDVYELYQNASQAGKSDIVDLLASIVMACPNLERITGFNISYDHSFDRLSHALSTRRNLRERIWILENHKRLEIPSDSHKSISNIYFPYDDPIETFVQHSDNWLALETLVLHAQRPGCMNFRSFIATFRKLPSLKNLLLSNFSSEEFNDRTLQALPALHSLRLQDLHGVTDKGLLRFATSEAAKTLRSLSLIDLEIMLLCVISKFLSSLPELRRFTLVQDGSPGLIPGAVAPFPVFQSKSLQFLHWDILVPGTANDDLASSVEAGAFPSLRTIRAPSDHDGLLQDLCRPLAQIAHTNDRHLVRRMDVPTVSETHYLRSLTAARRAAQERIEDARRRPGLKVVVEEEGVIQHVYTIRAYMGTVGSQIEYSLEPDVKGSENAVIGVPYLLKVQSRAKDFRRMRWIPGSGGCSHPLKRQHVPVELGKFF